MRWIYLIIFSTFCISATAQSEFSGLCGSALKSYLKQKFAPKAYISNVSGKGGAWEIFKESDSYNINFVIDRYSLEKYTFSADGLTPPSGMTIDKVVNPLWWGKHDTSSIDWDLYNLIPCNSEVPTHKKNYPPGELTDTIYSNEVWASGIGIISGQEVNFYSPPKGYEGDFARIILYMATIYSGNRWYDLGVNFFSDNNYPTINNYAKRILLKWHIEDPVDRIELHRNDVIESFQHNRNPFVDYPDLIDYIWGDKSSEPYIPEQEKEKIPLRANYKLSDEKIDLYSPFIPTDVKWTINGQPITGESLIPKELGAGIHELRYNSASTKGKLLIMIE